MANDDADGLAQAADEVPQERVFCVVQLYLTDDNRIAGTLDYQGNKLKALNTPDNVALECNFVARLLGQHIKVAFEEAGVLAKTASRLMGIFGGKESDDKTEGSGPDESAAGVSYGGEGGVELDGAGVPGDS